MLGGSSTTFSKMLPFNSIWLTNIWLLNRWLFYGPPSWLSFLPVRVEWMIQTVPTNLFISLRQNHEGCYTRGLWPAGRLGRGCKGSSPELRPTSPMSPESPASPLPCLPQNRSLLVPVGKKSLGTTVLDHKNKKNLQLFPYHQKK